MKGASFFEVEKEFIERAHSMIWCSVATQDTRNRLRSRILHPIWESATGWVGSRRHTLKAKHIAHNPYVSVAYISDPAKPVYVDCLAKWADDAATKARVWELFRSTAPPLGFDYGTLFDGPDAEEFGVLKLTPWRIELFDVANVAGRKVWTAGDGS